ncbi:MAG: DUF1190 domain-containing protein [Candidatus Thiodiazotropha sp.]
MKRTKKINLDAMRKRKRLTPTILAASISMILVGCSDIQNGKIYKTVNQCINENPSHAEACETAYQAALSEAERSGPKYRSISDCAVDFDRSQCVESRSGGVFMPLMAGFMIGRLLDNGRGYQSAPIYTSYRYGSPLYGSWHGSDGANYGRSNYHVIKTDKSAFKTKPAVTRTMSRGGFGSVAKAKASWSSSKSSFGGFRGGWGG